eukprot:scaffold290_cov364-Prasinococcus_capsulatus_cf.AAC.1
MYCTPPARASRPPRNTLQRSIDRVSAAWLAGGRRWCACGCRWRNPGPRRGLACGGGVGHP